MKFWKDLGWDSIPLLNAFLRIYALASNKDGLVCECGKLEGECWIWDVPLRRSLFDWEIAQWNSFMLALNCISIQFGFLDALAWTFCPNGSFSVKSFIRCLEEKGDMDSSAVCPLLWLGFVPLKVEVFLWQLLKGRILVREVLCNFGMVQMASTDCPLCGREAESVNHLFLHCDWSWKLWS